MRPEFTIRMQLGDDPRLPLQAPRPLPGTAGVVATGDARAAHRTTR